MMYWAFTTLSTVGLGDYYPMSNYERALSSVGFLMGVAVFSYIMGNFAEIIQFILEVDSDLEEGEQLTIFLSLFKFLNNGEDIKLELKEEIENYFDYRWANNSNWAVETEDDLMLLGQLPDDIQSQIFSICLYQNFMYVFRKDFEFPNTSNTRVKHSFYNMNHNGYRVFMIQLYKGLNPIRMERRHKIYSELDDVSQVTYVMKGKYRVGYEVNRKETLKIQLTKGSKIGAFECCYDKRSIYVYRAVTEVEGFFITKKNWKQLEADHPMFFTFIRRQALEQFVHVIRYNLEKCKEKVVNHYDKRSDYEQVLVLRDYNADELKNIMNNEYQEEDETEHQILDKNKNQLKDVTKNFTKTNVENMNLMESFGVEYDTSRDLNQLVDEENEAIRDENHKLLQGLLENNLVESDFDCESHIFEESDESVSKHHNAESEVQYKSMEAPNLLHDSSSKVPKLPPLK